MHDTVTDLERRYTDLSARYREARERLDEVGTKRRTRTLGGGAVIRYLLMGMCINI